MPAPPTRFEEAVPSGDAFENGVASLLGPSTVGPPVAPTDLGVPGRYEPDAGPGGLQKRQRGASGIPIGEGRPVAAPSRSPEEVRSMLSRYRDGLQGGRRSGAADGSTAPGPDHHDREER